MRLYPLLVAGLVLGCAEQSTAPASTEVPGEVRLGTAADQYWQRSSFAVDATIPMPCLGEDVRFFGEVPFQYHQVTSSSGVFTYHLQLRPNTPNLPPFYAQGLTSGKLYQYANGLPVNATVQIGSGSVTNIVDNEVYVAADGSKIIGTFQLHMTVNANGDLTVSKVDPVTFECVPGK